ncbi:MAG: AAA family ATPase [Candidatus Thorarchaeota archaeon]
MNQFLLVLCGIPASGKTTFAENILKLVEKELPVKIVSTDYWRDAEYYAEFKPSNEHRVRKAALEKTRELLVEGFSVIHDDTNYYTSMRHELYEIAKAEECAFGIIRILTPINTALKWNKQRSQMIPEKVITRIYEKFEDPGTKYAWDKPLAKVDLSKSTTFDSTKLVLELVTKLNRIGRKEITQNTNENLYDIATRKVVSAFLKDQPSCRNDPEVFKIRREILRLAKENEFSREETEEMLWKRLAKLTYRAS